MLLGDRLICACPELFYDRGQHHDFTTLVTEFAPSGFITEDRTLPFDFQNVEKLYESYNGINVRLRYLGSVLLRLTLLSQILPAFDDHCQEIHHQYREGAGLLGSEFWYRARNQQRVSCALWPQAH
jgi:hypothetical protein